MAQRDNNWLQQMLDEVWDNYFADVPQHNFVRIAFGRRARNRLGSIKIDSQQPDVSIITINGLFKSQEVPSAVVRATIVHELSHYAHGFNSPLQQKHRHPHAGGVMRAEFRQRGLESLYLEQKSWLKANWADFVQEHLPTKPARRPTGTKVPRPFWFRA